MGTRKELLAEVYRRARALRLRQLRRRKVLLGAGCAALSLLLALLLSRQGGMDVAAHPVAYGALVFTGRGNRYIIIALVAFLLGLLTALGLSALRKRLERRRLERLKRRLAEASSPRQER